MKKNTSKKSSVKKTGGLVASERKWEIENALSTLKRADEIRKDSKMMADVKKLANEQMSVLKNFSK